MEDIRQYEVTRKFLNENRWFVVFRMPFNGKKRMPLSNYVWLFENPQFEGIPSGYCIHHLDHDQINNDISNLALMKKSHHMAYHTKQNKGASSDKIKLREAVGIGKDLNIPYIRRVGTSEKTPLWHFRWQETDPNGNRVTRQITNIRGKRFRTEKEVEKAKRLFMKIHPFFNQDKERIKHLICEINQDIDLMETEDAYDIIKKVFPSL